MTLNCFHDYSFLFCNLTIYCKEHLDFCSHHPSPFFIQLFQELCPCWIHGNQTRSITPLPWNGDLEKRNPQSQHIPGRSLKILNLPVQLPLSFHCLNHSFRKKNSSVLHLARVDFYFLKLKNSNLVIQNSCFLLSNMLT